MGLRRLYCNVAALSCSFCQGTLPKLDLDQAFDSKEVRNNRRYLILFVIFFVFLLGFFVFFQLGALHKALLTGRKLLSRKNFSQKNTPSHSYQHFSSCLMTNSLGYRGCGKEPTGASNGGIWLPNSSGLGNGHGP